MNLKDTLLTIKSTKPTIYKIFLNVLPLIEKKITFTISRPEMFYAIIHDLDTKPICDYCKNDRTFYGIPKGYSHTCGSKRCAGKYSMSINPKAKENLLKHRKNLWSVEERTIQSNKAKVFNSNIYKKEKTRKSNQEKYGVDNVFQLKSVKTKIKNTMECNGSWLPSESQTDFYNYCKLVMVETRKQNISDLVNYDKRGRDTYHLDHKYSKFEGFRDGILPSLIGGLNNLEFIPSKENLSKNKKSSISCYSL